jgi:protein disulfide-isomerase A6
MKLLFFIQIAFSLANVITANHKNFKKIVLESTEVVMVEFFAPWCGHCKKLEPEYRAAAGKLKGLVKLVAVDCDNSANRELCSRYGVQGFPTIKIFGEGKKGAPTDYQGAREASAIVSTMKSAITGKYVSKIGGKAKNAIDLDKFKESNDLAKVVLFTDKKVTPLLYKALSIKYLNRLSFAEIQSSNTELVTAFGVGEFPSLFVFPKDSTEYVKYEGEIKNENVVEFLSKYAPVEASSKSESKPKKKESVKPKSACNAIFLI